MEPNQQEQEQPTTPSQTQEEEVEELEPEPQPQRKPNTHPKKSKFVEIEAKLAQLEQLLQEQSKRQRLNPTNQDLDGADSQDEEFFPLEEEEDQDQVPLEENYNEYFEEENHFYLDDAADAKQTEPQIIEFSILDKVFKTLDPLSETVTRREKANRLKNWGPIKAESFELKAKPLHPDTFRRLPKNLKRSDHRLLAAQATLCNTFRPLLGTMNEMKYQNPNKEKVKQGLLDTARMLTSALSQLTVARERAGLEYLDANNANLLQAKRPSLLGPDVMEELYNKQKQEEKFNDMMRKKRNQGRGQFFRGREERRQPFSSPRSRAGYRGQQQRQLQRGQWQQRRPQYYQSSKPKPGDSSLRTVQVSHQQWGTRLLEGDYVSLPNNGRRQVQVKK